MLIAPFIQWRKSKNKAALIFSLSWIAAYLYMFMSLIGYRIFSVDFGQYYNDLRFLFNILQMIIFAMAQGVRIDDLRKSKVEAVAENEAKSNFLATMSHEIRTPMNGVIGMADVLYNTPLNTEQKKYLGVIKGSANTLLTVINDILDYSKIEAGKLELENARLNVQELLSETMMLFQTLADKNHTQLTGLIDPAVPKAIYGDEVRIKQVLHNLLSNAIKFSSGGRVVIKIYWQKDKGLLEFVVRDSGTGIAKDKLGKLFLPFEQVSEGSQYQYYGTGLGLSISKRLVEAMGGDISVRAKLGKGSVFKFLFPAKVAEDKKPVSEIQLSARQILLLSDDKYFAASTGKWVDKWKGKLQLAGSKENILPLIEGIDVVIIDAELTEDLIETIKELINIYPKLPLVQVVPSDRDSIHSLPFIAGPGIRMPSLLAGPICKALNIPFEEEHDDRHKETLRAVMPTKRILVAEDNPVNQFLIKTMLEGMGHEVDIVGDGVEACEHYFKTLKNESRPYQILILDYNMPRLDGVSACRKIRAMELEMGKEPVPIVALTAHALPEFRQRCVEAGMNEYLTKPLVQKQLINVIEKFN